MASAKTVVVRQQLEWHSGLIKLSKPKLEGDLGGPRDPRNVEVKDKEKTYDKKILAEAWEVAATQR